MTQVSARVDEYGTRLVTVVALIGLGLVAALVALAYLFRPADLLTGELMLLVVPAIAALALPVVLWRWRRADLAAGGRDRRRD